MTLPEPWRKTSQDLAPAVHTPTPPGQYDVYPGFDIGPAKIARGFDALAGRIAGSRQATIDGFGGVFWPELREGLNEALLRLGIEANWTSIDDALLPAAEIETLAAPFLGGNDPVFGTRFTGDLSDFFDPSKLATLRALSPVPPGLGAEGANPVPPGLGAEAGIVGAKGAVDIVYGCGAALAGWEGPLVYVDIPKNEIQFRSRAKTVRNLGCDVADDPKPMYKRFYFVDWPALNKHKATLLPKIDTIVDAQRPDDPAVAAGDDLRLALDEMARTYFRVRPWFEPGPWGGQWIKEKIPALPQSAPNYAWSFELIVPENGLALESDGNLLEVSFDFLMFHDARGVVGDYAGKFGYEFPIRFDFLDTFDGGNLSLQCHPRPGYVRRNFGETFTQDETYYILDCTPDAHVYLGFKEGIDAAAFRADLERSFRDSAEIDVEKYVNVIPAHKHDLFLIPNGTIHCSGKNSLVLEISATPYIFTFKMYDWMRLDLDGRPRPLNIDRALDNLYFERQGPAAIDELVSKQSVISETDHSRTVHVPTHPEHFYDVYRLEFTGDMTVETNGSCQIMSLVEGDTVVLEVNGRRQTFSYAETFVVPAAAERFTLRSENGKWIQVIQSFMKPMSAETNYPH